MKPKKLTPDWSIGKQPLYLQLATIFRRRVETGLWPRGEQTPTLEMLMREFGVGRVTVRSALAELESEGLLVRSRGKGTFIQDLPANAPQKFVVGTTWEELVARGNLNALTVSLNTAREAAWPLPAWCGTQAGQNQKYYLLERVYSRQGIRVCYSRVFLEASIYRRLKTEIRQQAVLTVLGNDRQTHIQSGKQSITIISAGDDTAAHLHIPVGSPVAEITRSIYDTENKLIYWACVHYDSRYIRLDFDLVK
ncbi:MULTISPECIES: GntR family transcriptional regulator [Comamonas]|jgi:GntR family transcriptional regulator|uniref:GntR family transcriptional regulator n=1 Tax=Comamonas TaxID=283 RepID=UPI001CE1F421|nr:MULTISPECIES: GntR family transcriptional regulator [Comamonas]MDH1289959.1 GntR family transcriptional regulator [Comamonas terrigena]MDH1502405.1 GntR family transcriptional regulator [Comamonas terrigena]